MIDWLGILLSGGIGATAVTTIMSMFGAILRQREPRQIVEDIKSAAEALQALGHDNAAREILTEYVDQQRARLVRRLRPANRARFLERPLWRRLFVVGASAVTGLVFLLFLPATRLLTPAQYVFWGAAIASCWVWIASVAYSLRLGRLQKRPKRKFDIRDDRSGITLWL
jgi:hypothetical protein